MKTEDKILAQYHQVQERLKKLFDKRTTPAVAPDWQYLTGYREALNFVMGDQREARMEFRKAGDVCPHCGGENDHHKPGCPKIRARFNAYQISDYIIAVNIKRGVWLALEMTDAGEIVPLIYRGQRVRRETLTKMRDSIKSLTPDIRGKMIAVPIAWNEDLPAIEPEKEIE